MLTSNAMVKQKINSSISAIMQYLLKHNSATIDDLTKSTGLCRTTITDNIEKLESADLVYKYSVPVKIGRPKFIYMIMYPDLGIPTEIDVVPDKIKRECEKIIMNRTEQFMKEFGKFTDDIIKSTNNILVRANYNTILFRVREIVESVYLKNRPKSSERRYLCFCHEKDITHLCTFGSINGEKPPEKCEKYSKNTKWSPI